MSKDKSAPPKENPTGGNSVLVADADAGLRSSIVNYLKQGDYCAVEVADGLKATAAIAKEHYDLAFISQEIPSKTCRSSCRCNQKTTGY